MKIIKTANYDKLAQLADGRYEIVASMQGEEALDALRILQRSGPAAAIDHLSQWHFPGQQERTDEIGMYEDDEIDQEGPYILYYNVRRGYIGLLYDVVSIAGDMINHNLPL